MSVTSCDSHCAGQPRWNSRLPVVIVAPSDDRAIGFQCEVVITTCSDRHDTSQTRWSCSLAIIVGPPRDHRTIRSYRQTV